LALFDLDGTLVDREAAFRLWAKEFVAAHRLGAGGFARLLEADAGHAGPRDRFFAHVCREFGLAQPVADLWRAYRRRMPELVSCRAEDLTALRRLRSAGWRVGIVTNGMADNQLAKIHNTGLAALVDGWCVSGEVGIRKPDPAIFHLAAERCGAPAGAGGGWMVGDSRALDIAGGHAAGMRTIWVRQPDATDIQPPPDVTVTSIPEAVDTLLDSTPTGR